MSRSSIVSAKTLSTIVRHNRVAIAMLVSLAIVILLSFSQSRRATADTGAGSISLTTIDVAMPTETLNTLSNTAGSTTNTTLPAGWYITEGGGGARDNEQYAVDTGGSNTGDIYSYGSAAATERALGELRSGTLIPLLGAKFTNNTGVTITSLDVSYTGEQWRIGNISTARDDRMDFQISTNATDLSTGTYTDVNALDFTNPVKTAAAAGALDGNNAANRIAISSTISGLSIPDGASFFVRWSDLDASGADDGLAVDDFSVTPHSSSTPTLTINDVTQDEGNAATTSFTFTVSLSSSTHSGVTFDIATADGTAQDGNPGGEDTDYTAKSLTSQTIPNGSITYQFTVNINGDVTTEPNETFFVNVTNVAGATVTDGQGQGTITNDDVTLTPIHTIQGNGTSSPLLGNSVSTSGIVTLLRTSSNAGSGTASGFFLQDEDADADADPSTSEGIFVFTSSVPAVAVGDSVRVTGTVAEFNGLTEISSVTSVSTLSTGNPLPSAVTLDATILDPTASPSQPQLEKYEAMRMSGSSLISVAPNDNFFEIDTVLSSVARPMREPGIPISLTVPNDPTSGTPDCCIPRWDENPERIKLDTNGRAGAPNTPYTSNVTFTNVTGPLDYAFGEYRLIPDAALTASSNLSAVPLPTPTASEFTIGGFNIENFNNNAAQRQKAALGIRTVMNLPDIIGLAEIFDLADLQALRDQINNDTVSAGGANPQYEAYLIEQDGVSEDSDQDVGFLVKTSRVQVNAVTQERQSETYINPVSGLPETLHDRPPLVLDANIDPGGANLHVFVVVNHLRSFIDIDQDPGDGPRVRAKRTKQAESIADLLNDLQTANPTASVVSIGDYNSYQFNDGYTDPISVIKGSPTADDQVVVDQSPDLVDPNFTNLIDDLATTEKYSFIFEGTPQALDHILVNTVARARSTRIAIAHMNADFPDSPAATYANDATKPERSSDHDAPVAYFSLGAQQAPGTVIISELRFRGPGVGDPGPTGPAKAMTEIGTLGIGSTNSVVPSSADQDEFVEIYNNTNSDITVSTTDGSPGWTVVASTGIELCRMNNGTILPARGHYLCTNSGGYSLNSYAIGDTAWFGAEIPNGGGVALFRTNKPANYTSAERLDAAGYAGVDALYREGAGFPSGGAELTGNLQYSFVRTMMRATGGLPNDTGDNAADFIGVSTNGAITGQGQYIGAPGPENLFSPINRTSQFSVTLLDSGLGTSAPPNRVRNLTDFGPNSPNGTLTIRRRFTNNTGAPVDRLRFRLVEVTTFNAVLTVNQADIRALNSGDEFVAVSSGPPAFVLGTTLEEPPTQPLGGGWNSSLIVPAVDGGLATAPNVKVKLDSPTKGTILLNSPIASGGTVNIQFRLGVVTTGNFFFFVNIEAGNCSQFLQLSELQPSPLQPCVIPNKPATIK
jgi:predicted extracellular nuclease